MKNNLSHSRTLAARLFAAALMLGGADSARAGVHYVDLNSTNATPPYTSWASAATNIQDAVDVAVAGDEIAVTNGVYQTGARDVYGMSNRVAVTKSVAVRSVNGPTVTSIVGSGSSGPEGVRCIYLTNAALLAGFTLTNGATQDSGDFYKNLSGGGVWCESTKAVISNCVLTGNSASFFSASGGTGGGAYSGTLINCTLTNNAAVNAGGAEGCTLNNCTLTRNGAALQGGGAESCTLNNCTLVGNSARHGGGAYYSTLNNCTLTGNSAAFDGPGASGGTLNNCIVGDISSAVLNHCWTTDPLFVDRAGGNLRLQSNSPCINAGLNSLVPAGPDLDGNPRIAGGTVDIGAYEFQSPASKISYAWLQQFNLPINALTDAADPDGDGVNNYREWLAGSDPTNRFSFPPLLTVIPDGANVILTWPTNAVGFTLQSTTNLVPPTVWNTNSPAPTVADGQNAVTNPITGPQQFYRLVQ